MTGTRTHWSEGAAVNGKRGDNPLSDLTIHGLHPFSLEIEAMLLRVQELGERPGRWPLGENWPFSPREFDWEKGDDLDGARRDLSRFIEMLEAGRGDELMVDPLTHRPLASER